MPRIIRLDLNVTAVSLDWANVQFGREYTLGASPDNCRPRSYGRAAYFTRHRFVSLSGGLVAEAFLQPLLVHLTAPLPHHDRGDAVADQIRDRHRLAHEPMDAEDERDAGDRDDARGRNRSREHDERGAGDACGSFRREQEHGEQRELVPQIERRVGRLGNEHGRRSSDRWRVPSRLNE